MSDKLIHKIIDEHYQKIYNYCYSQLEYNHHAAADCTQDVFLIMLRKRKILIFSKNIKLWLYRTADNVIRSYKKKNSRNSHADIESCIIPVENDFEIKGGSVFDTLSQEELELLQDYYGENYRNRAALAEKYGISIENLYKKIHDIKIKLK